MKSHSEACERNKEPILVILRGVFANTANVLEIGSGTGQHAVHFAQHLPHLTWQPADLEVHHAGIKAWMQEANLPNLPDPLTLDVDGEWPEGPYEAAFSANTAHIISWPQVERLFDGVGKILTTAGRFVLYGPFNYNGNYSSESNAMFDQSLRARDPLSGIRDFEAVEALATKANMTLQANHSMPANNQALVWEKK